MKAVNLLIVLVSLLLCSSYGRVSTIPNRGTIKLHKLGKAFTSGGLEKAFKTIPVDKLVNMRGGSIADTFNNAVQSANSLSAVSESISMFAQQYLVAPWTGTPPLTKVFVGLSFLATTLAAIFNDNEWPEELHFDLRKTIQEFQLWRPFTSFLHLGDF